jgi:hypothetical protein
MRYLVTASKHVNDTRTITRQPPITRIGKLLEAVFSVGSAPRAPGRLSDFSSRIFADSNDVSAGN